MPPRRPGEKSASYFCVGEQGNQRVTQLIGYGFLWYVSRTSCAIYPLRDTDIRDAGVVFHWHSLASEEYHCRDEDDCNNADCNARFNFFAHGLPPLLKSSKPEAPVHLHLYLSTQKTLTQWFRRQTHDSCHSEPNIWLPDLLYRRVQYSKHTIFYQEIHTRYEPPPVRWSRNLQPIALEIPATAMVFQKKPHPKWVRKERNCCIPIRRT